MDYKRIIEIANKANEINQTMYGFYRFLGSNRNLDETMSYRGRDIDLHQIKNLVHKVLHTKVFSVPKLEREEKIEFINFEDVKELLSKELEIKYQKELADLRASKKDFDNNTLYLKEKHIRELRAVNDTWEKTSQFISDELEKTEKKLQDTINDKDTRKKEIILEEKIAELQKELEKEKSKGLFKKLFK